MRCVYSLYFAAVFCIFSGLANAQMSGPGAIINQVQTPVYPVKDNNGKDKWLGLPSAEDIVRITFNNRDNSGRLKLKKEILSGTTETAIKVIQHDIMPTSYDAPDNDLPRWNESAIVKYLSSDQLVGLKWIAVQATHDPPGSRPVALDQFNALLAKACKDNRIELWAYCVIKGDDTLAEEFAAIMDAITTATGAGDGAVTGVIVAHSALFYNPYDAATFSTSGGPGGGPGRRYNEYLKFWSELKNLKVKIAFAVPATRPANPYVAEVENYGITQADIIMPRAFWRKGYDDANNKHFLDSVYSAGSKKDIFVRIRNRIDVRIVPVVQPEAIDYRIDNIPHNKGSKKKINPFFSYVYKTGNRLIKEKDFGADGVGLHPLDDALMSDIKGLKDLK